MTITLDQLLEMAVYRYIMPFLGNIDLNEYTATEKGGVDIEIS